jgi:hypothetical protein
MKASRMMPALAIWCSATCIALFGQTFFPSLVEMDLQNTAFYISDVTDYTKLASDPNMTVSPFAGRPYLITTAISDIVAVNGRPAKGTWVSRITPLNLRPMPQPGQAVADVLWANISDQYLDILQADGTRVGTIMMAGFGGGSPPPGAPQAVITNNLAITGGTGAFLGIRGQVEQVSMTSGRATSVSEDPSNRRNYAGGSAHWILHLIPMSPPEVMVTGGGPMIVHANDFSAVNSAKPAKAGEILSLFASGLGPTRPGVDPGTPFPADPLQEVNSPVEVTINGQTAEVLYAFGYPGAVDQYRVDLRLPATVATGTATLQLRVAWIVGPAVKIPVQ